MLRDAGCSGRLTAAVDAIDAAMLELPHDHRCVGQMPISSFAQLCPDSGA